MTELSFLIDLLLKHKLPAKTREVVASRIADVEAKYSTPVITRPPDNPLHPYAGPPQAPSTLAAMAKHAVSGFAPAPTAPEVQAPTVIAQTPAAQAALAARNAAIQGAMSGKPDPGQKSPKKFHQ